MPSCQATLSGEGQTIWSCHGSLSQKPNRLTQVNGDKERMLVKRFGVQAYPSIYFVKGAETWEYSGAATEVQVPSCRLASALKIVGCLQSRLTQMLP